MKNIDFYKILDAELEDIEVSLIVFCNIEILGEN